MVSLRPLNESAETAEKIYRIPVEKEVCGGATRDQITDSELSGDHYTVCLLYTSVSHSVDVLYVIRMTNNFSCYMHPYFLYFTSIKCTSLLVLFIKF